MNRAALKWFVATCLHLLALPDSDQPSTRPSKPSLRQPQHRHHHHIRPLPTFALNVTDALQFCSSPPSVTLTIKSFPIHQSWVAILSLSKFFPWCVLSFIPRFRLQAPKKVWLISVFFLLAQCFLGYPFISCRYESVNEFQMSFSPTVAEHP